MPGKVLIADPNLSSCKNLEILFRERSYDVDSVSNGDDVITKVFEFQPHIILLSVAMPGKTGYEICSLIKNDNDLKDIVVVLTFSENETFDYTRARESGATRFLPKSVEPGLLISILSFILAGDSSTIKYSKPLSDNHSIVNANSTSKALTREQELEEIEELEELEEIEELEELEEIEVMEELEDDQNENLELSPIDYENEERIDTLEVESSNSLDYEIEEEIITKPVSTSTNQPSVTQDATPINEEFNLEQNAGLETTLQVSGSQEINKVSTTSEQNVNSQIAEQSPNRISAEIPHVQMPAIASAQEIGRIFEQAIEPVPLIDRVTGHLETMFGTPIIANQFEYTEEDLEDPLEIKHQLNSISCRECGAMVLKEDVFCVECGAAVDETLIQVPTDLSCDSCGQIVNPGDVFCLNCGSVQ